MEGWLTEARRDFHRTLMDGPLSIDAAGVPTNADKSSQASIDIAKGILSELGPARTAQRLPGQTSGAGFEDVCRGFVEVCFGRLKHMRPGSFRVSKGTGIAKFEQYTHLARLEQLAKTDPDIATALGSDYVIKPDVLISRSAESDDSINSVSQAVDLTTGRHSPIRAVNQQEDILHASISCKWTLRSDRAQNARSEAMNLIRNRKGRMPHIAVVVGEPMPARIASLALGTGDVDCVYHFALPELQKTLANLRKEDAEELVATMVQGKRLRDIADLPLDLLI